MDLVKLISQQNVYIQLRNIKKKHNIQINRRNRNNRLGLSILLVQFYLKIQFHFVTLNNILIILVQFVFQLNRTENQTSKSLQDEKINLILEGDSERSVTQFVRHFPSNQEVERFGSPRVSVLCLSDKKKKGQIEKLEFMVKANPSSHL